MPKPYPPLNERDALQRLGEIQRRYWNLQTRLQQIRREWLRADEKRSRLGVELREVQDHLRMNEGAYAELAHLVSGGAPILAERRPKRNRR